MLQNYILQSKGTVHPFGDNIFTYEDDFEWKQKKLAVSTKPTSNSYNLVQLKAQPEKQFVNKGHLKDHTTVLISKHPHSKTKKTVSFTNSTSCACLPSQPHDLNPHYMNVPGSSGYQPKPHSDAEYAQYEN